MNELIWYVPAAYIWCYIGSKVPLGDRVRVNQGRYDNRSPRTANELTGKGLDCEPPITGDRAFPPSPRR